MANSIDQTFFIDGVQQGATPDVVQAPPNPGAGDFFTRSYMGHWPSTTTCATASDPCSFVVGKPAVTPGENTVLFYTAWLPADREADGSHVFKYTIDGSLNGSPAM